MRCNEFETRLNHLLDRRRDPRHDRIVANHADDCGDCRRLMDAYLGICEGLSGLASPVPADDLGERVLCELARQPAPSSRRWLAPWAAIAAALLVFVATRDRQPHQPVAAPAPALAAAPVPVPVIVAAPAPAQTPSAPVGVLARQATEKYADLARDTQSALAGMSMLLPHMDIDMDLNMDEPAAQSDPVNDDASPLTTQVAAGLKPLADSTTGAMSFLWNMLPHSQPAGGTLPQPTSGNVAPLVRTDTI